MNPPPGPEKREPIQLLGDPALDTDVRDEAILMAAQRSGNPGIIAQIQGHIKAAIPAGRIDRTIRLGGANVQLSPIVNDAISIIGTANKIVRERLPRAWAAEIARERRVLRTAPPPNPDLVNEIYRSMTSSQPLQSLQAYRVNPGANIQMRQLPDKRYREVVGAVELYMRASKATATDNADVRAVIQDWRTAGIPLGVLLDDPLLPTLPRQADTERAQALIKGQQYIDGLKDENRRKLTEPEKGLLAEYKGSAGRRRRDLMQRFPAIPAIEAKAEGRPFTKAEKLQARGAEKEDAEFLALLKTGYPDATPPIPGLLDAEYNWFLHNSGRRTNLSRIPAAPSGTTRKEITQKVAAIRNEQKRRAAPETPAAQPAAPRQAPAPAPQAPELTQRSQGPDPDQLIRDIDKWLDENK